MSRRLPQVTVLLVALAVGAAGTAVLATGPASAQATSIDSCTVIDEPGHYVLTQDVDQPGETESACIEIRSSDVFLDGDGHVITGNSYGTVVGTNGSAAVENVSVVDLTVRQGATNVRFENVTDGRVVDVTSEEPESAGAGVAVVESERVEIRDGDLGANMGSPAVRLRDVTDVAVENNAVTGGYVTGIDAERTNRSRIAENAFDVDSTPVDLSSGAGNVVANNTFEQRPEVAIAVGGQNSTVTGNAIGIARNGISVSGSGHTVADNDATRISGWAASAEGRNHKFTNNRFGGGDGIERSGGALELAGGGHLVASNDLQGVHGVYLQNATGPTTIRHNDVDAIYGVRVDETELCLPRRSGGAVVDVRANNFTADDGDGQYYGVLNEDEQVVTATNNYWGAQSGPSSPSGENVSDPITGTAADGGGAPVSSGVHFDPWLGQEPANQSGA
ncbi:right-handed parallel beta-helix repeat-containing protein [Halobacteria archaeon HArc-gm2]|nr:right-handed parallel beta-helix repeat-containing protein [Halobacteria archaeon HArc-gm2]